MASAARWTHDTTPRPGRRTGASSSRSSRRMPVRPVSRWPARRVATSFRAERPPSSPMSQSLQTFLIRAIPAIPADLKVLLRILQDEDLADETRLEAVGAVLYTLSAGDLVPDSMGVLGYVDD